MAGEDRVVARVGNHSIAKLIGKKGRTIELIEKRLGIHISVEPKEATFKEGTDWRFEESGAFVNIKVNPELTGEQVDVYFGENYIFSPFVGKKGVIRVKKKSDLGRKVMGAIYSKRLRVLT
jgi:ATPase